MNEPADDSLSHLHKDIVLDRLSTFVHLLRQENFICDTSSMLDAVRVTEADYLPHRLHLKQGLRACLCHTLEEWRRFDALFDFYWRSVKDSEENFALYSTKIKCSISNS